MSSRAYRTTGGRGPTPSDLRRHQCSLRTAITTRDGEASSPELLCLQQKPWSVRPGLPQGVTKSGFNVHSSWDSSRWTAASGPRVKGCGSQRPRAEQWPFLPQMWDKREINFQATCEGKHNKTEPLDLSRGRSGMEAGPSQQARCIYACLTRGNSSLRMTV